MKNNLHYMFCGMSTIIFMGASWGCLAFQSLTDKWQKQREMKIETDKDTEKWKLRSYRAKEDKMETGAGIDFSVSEINKLSYNMGLSSFCEKLGTQ